MNLSIIGVVPWREAMQSQVHRGAIHRKAVRDQRGVGRHGAGSVDRLRLRLRAAARLQPHSVRGGGRTATSFAAFATPAPAAGSFRTSRCSSWACWRSSPRFWNLDAVISALLTSRILIQFIGQILALRHLRKHRPDIVRPFRMWLYPLPSIIALLGWVYIFLTSGWAFAGFGVLTLAAGVAAYAVWKRVSPA